MNNVPAAKKPGLPVWAIVLIILAAIGVLFVVVGGVMAALAVNGMKKYMSNAKTAEAKHSVSAIARAAQAAYENEAMDPTGKPIKRLCGSATPVPMNEADVSGKKYMPRTSGGDFDSGSADDGWKCLRFAVTTPMYYQVHYTKGARLFPAGPAAPESFEAGAQGDLNGDGVKSSFALTGEVDGTGSIRISPTVQIENEFE